MKYHDETFQPPPQLSTHIIEGKLKIVDTSDQSKEIISFYPILLCICRILYSSNYNEQNCHVLVKK